MAAYVTVKKGDSMYAIASQHGKKLADLQKYNPHVTDPSLIHVGDIIFLSPPNQLEKDYAALKRKFVTMQTVDTELYEKQLAEKDKIIKACNEDIRLMRESMKVINRKRNMFRLVTQADIDIMKSIEYEPLIEASDRRIAQAIRLFYIRPYK